MKRLNSKLKKKISNKAHSTETHDLISALGLGSTEHIAIVGSGGKTSLMFALSEALKTSGKRVVSSTTTKVWKHEAQKYPCVLFNSDDQDWRRKIKEKLGSSGHVFVGKNILESGKVDGISPDFADLIFRETEVDYTIVEADGAAGRPVKAPAEHEPVIPSSATLVIAVIGLEALRKAIDSDTVFRMEQFKAITNFGDGEIITPEVLERVIASPHGLFKNSGERSRKIVFLNKSDLLTSVREAEELRDFLLISRNIRIERVIVGSIKEKNYYPKGEIQ